MEFLDPFLAKISGIFTTFYYMGCYNDVLESERFKCTIPQPLYRVVILDTKALINK